MRMIRWTSGLLWIGSWYLMFLEVFRWHHMTKTLRFNPTPPPGAHGRVNPTPPPGVHVRAHPGGPLIAAWVCAIGAPLVFIITTAVRYRRVRR
jgi:hypothetical protein